MQSRQLMVLALLKNIWLILAVALILFVISQTVFTGRELVYNADFSSAVSRDIEGWYPESRAQYVSDSDSLVISGEPLYMKVYLPVKFKKMTITGSVVDVGQLVKIGLKTDTGDWEFQSIDREDFILEFDMDNSQRVRNRIEMILSAPEQERPITLKNNWRFKFTR